MRPEHPCAEELLVFHYEGGVSVRLAWLGSRSRGFITRGELQGVGPFDQRLRSREGRAVWGQNAGFAVEDLDTHAFRGVVVAAGGDGQQGFVGWVDLTGERNSGSFGNQRMALLNKSNFC